MSVTPEAMQAMFAAETDEVFLVRLKIEHESLAHPIRVVNDNKPLIVSSATAADMTGNGHDGAVNGAPAWVDGLVFGSAGLMFAGNDADHVLTPAINVGGSWTVEAPIKCGAIGSDQIFLGSRPFLGITPDGNARVGWDNSAAALQTLVEANGNREAGQIYHVAATHSGTTTILYVDGIEVARNAVEDSALVNTAFYIGRHDAAGYPFNGTIDEVRIWNRALSQKEIADNQARVIDAKSPGLVAYYQLDDGAYLPYAFEVNLPDDTAEQLPQVTLRIDNVDPVICETLRSMDSPATVTLDVVMASSPEVVEIGPFAFDLPSARYDDMAVEGTLMFEDLLNEKFPKDIMTPATTPGLF